MKLDLLSWTLPVLLLLAGPLAAKPKGTGTPTLTATPSVVVQEEIPPPPQETVPEQAPLRYFIGLGGSEEWLWGGFDGDTLRTTAQSVSILSPRIDPGTAFHLYGGLLGPRLPGPFGDLWGEFHLKRSQQRWVFQDGQDSSMLTSFTVRGRSAFFQQAPMEVFALAGLRYSLLELKNAAEEPGYIIGDASYSGLGLELGSGVLVELPFDFKARVDWVFLFGLTSGGSAFQSSLKENPWFFGGSLAFGVERYF